MQFTVQVRGRLVQFSSDFTDAEAVEICRGLNSDFARDLVKAAERAVLTSSRLAWIHKLAVDASRPAAPVVSDRFERIAAIFATAANEGKLKRPAITFNVDGGTIKIKRAGGMSRYAGELMVTDGKTFGDNQYFGRIDASGKFTPGRDLTPDVAEVLRKLDADPAKAAAEHGHRTGSCCFCDKRLTDDRSTDAGYGPVCAKTWGLPWGEIASIETLA